VSGCGKVRFHDEIAAKIALAKIRAKDNPRRPKTERRVYHCPKCAGWHLTSRP
jgi:hypothetical protein